MNENAVLKKKCLTCQSTYLGTMVVCPRDGTLLLKGDPDPYSKSSISSKYFVEKAIGKGTTSIVYEGLAVESSKPVAIKMLNCEIHDRQFLRKKERFLRQASAHVKLDHPNIVSLIDQGHTPKGLQFLVFELVKNGFSLNQFRGVFRDLPLNYFVEIFKQVCAALDYAHSHGIYHQDLAPGDILIEQTEGDGIKIKVTDFAKGGALMHGDNHEQQLTEQGDLFGHPEFMSPEVCLGQSIGAVSNIYSLGCLMYYALSAEPSFDGAHWGAVMLNKLKGDAKPLALGFGSENSRAVESMITRCMDLKQEARYQSVIDVAASLSQLNLKDLRISYSALASILV